MYRSQRIVCIARTSLRPVFLNPPSFSRTYTVPPPAGQGTPDHHKAKHVDNTLMYTTLGLVAAAGAYYYFRNTDEAQELKDKAKADQDYVKRKSAELAARAEDVKEQGKSKLDRVKTSGKEKLNSAEGIDELKTKYDSVKGSAKEKAEMYMGEQKADSKANISRE